MGTNRKESHFSKGPQPRSVSLNNLAEHVQPPDLTLTVNVFFYNTRHTALLCNFGLIQQSFYTPRDCVTIHLSYLVLIGLYSSQCMYRNTWHYLVSSHLL
ncbi:hypothetical protein ACOSQ3_029981 [Xanthoceras sorbifolium]